MLYHPLIVDVEMHLQGSLVVVIYDWTSKIELQKDQNVLIFHHDLPRNSLVGLVFFIVYCTFYIKYDLRRQLFL